MPRVHGQTKHSFPQPQKKQAKSTKQYNLAAETGALVGSNTCPHSTRMKTCYCTGCPGLRNTIAERWPSACDVEPVWFHRRQSDVEGITLIETGGFC